MELLDIRDAVNAIITMLKSNSQFWKPVYNLGSGHVASLIAIDRKVNQIAIDYNDGKCSEIKVEARETQMSFGMISFLFCNDLKWQPEYDLDKTIVSLMKYQKKNSQKIVICDRHI